MSLEADGAGESSVVYESPGPLERFRNSFSLKLAAGGLALIVIGYIIQTGVMAAVLAVWGGALVAIGLGMYAFIQWSLQGTQG